MACAVPGLLGFVVPAVLLLATGVASESALDARLLDWVANTALLGVGGAALVVPLALLGAYALRVSGGRWVRLAIGLANTGYAIPGLVLGVGLLVLAGLTSRGLAWIGELIGWQNVRRLQSWALKLGWGHVQQLKQNRRIRRLP